MLHKNAAVMYFSSSFIDRIFVDSVFFANKEENTKQNDVKNAIAIHQKMYFSPSSNNRIFANSMARKPVFV